MNEAVLNQPPPFEGINLFLSDQALVEALKREAAPWALEVATAFGSLAGSREVIGWGFAANENRPVLRTHDRFGNRIDEVEFHPAWHELMRLATRHGFHNSPWTEKRERPHTARAALYFLINQIEAGHCCPITMTYASIPTLRIQPEIAKVWEPRILSRVYDPECRPAGQKKGVICGMAMTEKQGGSDVRANTTRAVAAGKGGAGGEYLITGHKWFCSAPMSDAFFVLAQAPGGLSCFFLPRWKPDGTRNNFFIQRLKDKLGNRSNASSEVEFVDAWAQLIGEEGRGVATIIKMVNHTRLDCVIGSAAFMRQAAAQALHHTAYRSAFGKKLVEQPLMKNVLADLIVESEAATHLMMRLARSYDEAGEELFRRIATAVSKYWVCKRAPAQVSEALECLGGNGYVEESILPRLYRESPLNSIWEGSGNVNCLDVLRAVSREPQTKEALLAEIEKGRGADRRLDAFIGQLKNRLTDLEKQETQARRVVEELALALQGSLVVRHAPAAVADAFCASRLAGDWGRAFGTLPAKTDFDSIISRGRVS